MPSILSLRTLAAVLLVCSGTQAARAQADGTLPFLRMETDARVSAMAGAGTALAENPLAIYGNAAVALFSEKHGGAALFGNPKTGNRDDALWGGGGYWSPDGRNALLAGVRSFGGLEIPMTDGSGFPAGTARPRDLSAEAGYARLFGKRIAVALTARYIRSDLDTGEAPAQGVSFDVAAALRGRFGTRGTAAWTLGVHLSDLGPEVQNSDGYNLRLPTRGAFEGALLLAPHPKHQLRLAVDLGYRFSGGPFDASFGAEYLFLRHGILRAGYCAESQTGTGGHAAAGCGVIIGPVRCDVAYRFGGSEYDLFDNSLLFTIGFLL